MNTLSLFLTRGLYWSLNLDNEYQNEIVHKVYYADPNYKMYLIDYEIHEGKKCDEGSDEDIGDILEIRILGSLNKKGGKKCREEHIVKLNTIVDNLFCVGSEFTCSCKDFLHRSKSHNIVCKHIVFILCKISGIYDREYFKTKLLTSYQTEYIFVIIKNERLWRNTSVSIKYLNNNFKNQKELEEGDICNICLDDIKKDTTLLCPDCLNTVHEGCMKVWLDINRSCVFCRSEQWINYDKDTLDCQIIKKVKFN